MSRIQPRPFLAGVATCLVVGSVWGLLDALSSWDRTALFLRVDQVSVLLLTGLLTGALLGSVAGLFAGLVPRMRAPLTAGATALAALTLVTALARLVREPVLGRDVQLLPGGVYTAVAVSALAAGLPLLGVALASSRRPAAAVALWKVWALALVLVTWFTPWGGRVSSPTAEAPQDAPNLLLVTLDTFRADHLGALGAPGDPTPRMDALAGRGALFTRAFSQIPITGPSHMSILSGTYPWTHETLANGVAVPDDVPVLPVILGDSGYRTAAFVSAFVLDGAFGYGRGFQVYDDALMQPKGVFELSLLRVWDQLRVRFGNLSDVERRGDVTVDDALAWLDTVDERRPFFLWVHLFDPHGPYAPPPPHDASYYEGDPRDPAVNTMDQATGIAEYLLPSLEGITDLQWPVAQYKGEVAYTDLQVGRLLDGVVERDLDEDTVVVVVADHGESLTEHGYYFNHGAHLYEPSMHVPLTIVAPGSVRPGTTVDKVVENIDLLPTILELLYRPVPEGLPGQSLVPLMQGDDVGDGQALTICFDREANREKGAFMRYRRLGIRRAGLSFIYREEGPEEIYDLQHDPDELENLAKLASQGFLVQDLAAKAEEILAAAGSGAFERSELSAGTEERLRSLGYIEDDEPAEAPDDEGGTAAR